MLAFSSSSGASLSQIAELRTKLRAFCSSCPKSVVARSKITLGGLDSFVNSPDPDPPHHSSAASASSSKSQQQQQKNQQQQEQEQQQQQPPTNDNALYIAAQPNLPALSLTFQLFEVLRSVPWLMEQKRPAFELNDADSAPVFHSSIVTSASRSVLDLTEKAVRSDAAIDLSRRIEMPFDGMTLYQRYNKWDWKVVEQFSFGSIVE